MTAKNNALNKINDLLNQPFDSSFWTPARFRSLDQDILSQIENLILRDIEDLPKTNNDLSDDDYEIAKHNFIQLIDGYNTSLGRGLKTKKNRRMRKNRKSRKSRKSRRTKRMKITKRMKKTRQSRQ